MQHINALSNLDNVNVKNKFLNNVNINVKQVTKRVTAREASIIADWLMDELEETDLGNKPFFCKVAYKLTNPIIHRLLSTAKQEAKKSAVAYFVWLAKREMG